MNGLASIGVSLMRAAPPSSDPLVFRVATMFRAGAGAVLLGPTPPPAVPSAAPRVGRGLGGPV